MRAVAGVTAGPPYAQPPLVHAVATPLPRPIRAIVLADDRHAKRILDELDGDGGLAEVARVDDVASLRAQIERNVWDVVLSQWGSTKFSTSAALEVIHRLQSPIPLIVLCESIGEEAAAQAIRMGARDVVRFDSLGRLNTILMREVIGSGHFRTLRDMLRTELLAHEIGRAHV